MSSNPFMNLFAMLGQDPGYSSGGGEWEDQSTDWDTPMDPIESPRVRMVPPTPMQFERPAFDAYLEHVKSMPSRENYEPSLGRKILAGVAGGLAGLRDPSTGYKVSRSIVESPYQRALSDWSAKGKSFSDLAGTEQDFLGTASKERTEAAKVGLGYEELDAKIGDINRKYQVALKNAKSREEYNNVLKERNQLIEETKQSYIANQREANALRSRGLDIKEREADLEEGRLKLNQDEFEHEQGQVKPLDVNKMYNAELDVLRDAVQTDPRFQKYWKLDEMTGEPFPIQKEWSPEEQQELESLRTMIGMAAARRMEGMFTGGVPRVIPPMSRRRIP